VLNGYDTRHLKKTLRGAPRRPTRRPRFGGHELACQATLKRPFRHHAPGRGSFSLFGGGSPIRRDFSTFVVVTAIFMVAAMWVFPEAGVKKGDLKRSK